MYCITFDLCKPKHIHLHIICIYRVPYSYLDLLAVTFSTDAGYRYPSLYLANTILPVQLCKKICTFDIITTSWWLNIFWTDFKHHLLRKQIRLTNHRVIDIRLSAAVTDCTFWRGICTLNFTSIFFLSIYHTFAQITIFFTLTYFWMSICNYYKYNVLTTGK